jgi:hydrogenase expression/formation protein HypD
MRFITEYRDEALASAYLQGLHRVTRGSWTLMEICGGQTHSLVKNGILGMLPKSITMVHGPGCPVCVTPIPIIDEAIALARMPNIILCSYGDMLRVPGSKLSLLDARAEGGNVRIVYSPLEAVNLAIENPDREVVFFAVGFETTAPANALSVVHADRLGVHNFSILASHVLVPPAMEAILGDPECKIDAFLAAGHVCTIMGLEEYEPIVKKYRVPVVVTGFEPVDLLQGIFMAVQQLEQGEARLENQYARVVHAEGNPFAKDTIRQVFEVADREWRGIGTLPNSGYEVNKQYSRFNARLRFHIKTHTTVESEACMSGAIMRGLKKPFECPHFGTRCTPEHPLGAPMVSSEGACAAYYHFSSSSLQA